MGKILYIIFCVFTLGTYAVVEYNGWDFKQEKPQTIPADVRSSPGGYRSYHFWHSGYQGGK